MDKIEIEWIDSKSGPNEWEYREDLEPLLPIRCKTVGFLLEDTPEYKTIAQTVSDSQVHGRITIPSVCVMKIEKL